MKISAERAKQIFLALRLHFTSNYDYIKYHGKVKTNPIQQKEEWVYNRILRKCITEESVRDFFVANMVYSFLKSGKIETFINHYATKESFEIYNAWSAWWNASYNLLSDLKKFDSIKSMIEISNGEHPKIFDAIMEDNCSINTMASIVIVRKKLIEYWTKNCNDTILFGSYLKFIEKYVPLISKDKQKIEETINKYMEKN